MNIDWILRDGILRGRDESEGGPFRIYPCPSCKRENRIESLGSGTHYSSPAKDLGLVDWLVGWIDPLAPADFLRLQEWQQQFGEERRVLFEKAGLSNYSGLRWRQWLSRQKSIESESLQSHKNPGPGDEPSSGHQDPTPDLPLDHPLRILGLERDADPDLIRQRFRELVRKYHPDKHRSLKSDQVDQASEKLKLLISAYEKLEKDGKV